jgi:predicted O-linked N-acetylglucosamine transferase (SPINDLY family)
VDLKHPEDALVSYDRAIALKPDYAEAYYNRGNALVDLKRPEDALVSYDKAIALKRDYAEAYSNRGAALTDLKRPADALVSYDRAIALKPDLAGLEGLRLNTKMHLCDWSNFDNDCARLISSVRSGKGSTPPFQFLAIPSTSADQLKCAKLYIANKYPPSDKPIWQGERYNHKRLRVAYLSADFHQHPVSVAIAGMVERHDKSHFDVTAISLGADDNSELRQRLKVSSEYFIDARTYSDNQIANLVKEQEIDILVDLMGFTKDARSSIFAKRSAPIQVNYLGYPGTMGADYIDYIIADRIVIPENQNVFYSEKIVLLPNSYHVNDAKRSSTYRTFTRNELELPPVDFVFCCFNNNYKITHHVFDCWMRILKQVEGSVFWLLEDNATASTNLRKEAEARGVNADRLIFAKRMSVGDHLARHQLADLFLDTLPYNAHTTASELVERYRSARTCNNNIRGL